MTVDIKNISFEEALVPLEESLKIFRDAGEFIRICNDKQDSAQEEVKKIVDDVVAGE